ncbi:MAG: hypothetical protein O9972_03175 [Burkholderiales bacterium]|nr:hypothetical protein [Burkholderiales bacterium]
MHVPWTYRTTGSWRPQVFESELRRPSAPRRAAGCKRAYCSETAPRHRRATPPLTYVEAPERLMGAAPALRPAVGMSLLEVSGRGSRWP